MITSMTLNELAAMTTEQLVERREMLAGRAAKYAPRSPIGKFFRGELKTVKTEIWTRLDAAVAAKAVQ